MFNNIQDNNVLVQQIDKIDKEINETIKLLNDISEKVDYGLLQSYLCLAKKLDKLKQDRMDLIMK